MEQIEDIKFTVEEFLSQAQSAIQEVIMLELELEEHQTRAEHITSVLSEARSSNRSMSGNDMMASIIDSKDRCLERIAGELINAYSKEEMIRKFIRRNIKDKTLQDLLILRYIDGVSTNVLASLYNTSQRSIQRNINKALHIAQAKYEQKYGRRK